MKTVLIRVKISFYISPFPCTFLIWQRHQEQPDKLFLKSSEKWLQKQQLYDLCGQMMIWLFKLKKY